MANTNNTATASVNFGWAGFLFIVLLVLKVNPGGHLDSPVEDWSWWIITAPLWGGLAFLVAVLLIGGLVAGIFSLIRKRKFEKARKARLARGGPQFPRRY